MIKRLSLLKLLILSAILCISGCDFSPDTLKVVRWSPENNARGVANDAFFEMEFSAPVNKRDIEDNFSMLGSSGSVDGRFVWISEKVFRFTPAEAFSKNGRYAAEVPRSVRDSEGNTMGSDFISDFYVGDDFVIPVVEWSTPPFSPGAVEGIAVNENPVIAFSKSMDRESVENNFRLSPDAAGYYLWSESAPGLENSLLTYVLVKPMDYGKLYTLTVAGAAEDYAGNPLGAEYKVHFITGDDTTPPQVSGIYDAVQLPIVYWIRGSVNSGIDRGIKIAADFSEAMERQSVENAFSITPAVSGVFSWSSDSNFTFTPSAPLAPERIYQVRIDTGAKDINGLKLAEPYTVEFKTDSDSSLFVSCSGIEGSGDNINYNTLSGGTPGPDEWPLEIVPGGDDKQVYWIRIKFSSGSGDADMDPYSIFDNYLIETFKSAVVGDPGSPPGSAEVEDIEWINPSTAQIKIKGLYFPTSGDPFIYRFTVSGGAGGIRDRQGNHMKNDLVFEFREG
jgi:hypothetical protein